MEQAELDRIIEQVTRRVLEAVAERGSKPAPETDGFCKVLVVGGKTDEVPEALRRHAVLYDLEDYRAHQNILRYDRVLICALTVTQLCDIAQGRIGDAASCAVVHALLAGVETLMDDGACSYRKYAGRGSTALYQLLEGYERTLRAFGVKPPERTYDRPLPEAKPPKYAAPPVSVPKGSARPNFSRLITEAEAEQLAARGGAVRLPAGAIVTPSARDVFAAAGVSVTTDE